jgi:hypothetical protein
VATDVERILASPDGAEARLRALEPGSGTGLWIRPCHEISPTSIRFPLDLVFLDDECAVLDIVVSFPLASVPASRKKALSFLAFPADTLAKGEMRAGDQLIISKPEEMKQHLLRMKEAKAEASRSVEPLGEQAAIASAEEATGPAIEESVESGGDPMPAAPIEIAPVEIAPVETAPVEIAPVEVAPMEPAPVKAEVAGGQKAGTEKIVVSQAIETSSWKKRLGNRNWFTNLLLGDPADPRRALREGLPGLIAYFYTGGTPTAHEVRDISVTGMYIITNEGWYPGTVVRVTLTDRDHPTDDRTFTVNAKAVRRGRDGVGLVFILEEEDKGGDEMIQDSERTLGADHARVEAFLERLKTPPSRG